MDSSQWPINRFLGLLNRSQTSLQYNFSFLQKLGILPKKIRSYASLLFRNPETLRKYLEYLVGVGLSSEKILANPQLLAENPDAVIRKLLIFKLYILNLARKDHFNPNHYYHFWSNSPATLMAKKKYCMAHGLGYKKRLSLLSRPWCYVMKMAGKEINKEEANKIGREMTKPFKTRYDIWMKEYKQWAGKFEARRSRRLILKI